MSANTVASALVRGATGHPETESEAGGDAAGGDRIGATTGRPAAAAAGPDGALRDRSRLTRPVRPLVVLSLCRQRRRARNAAPYRVSGAAAAPSQQQRQQRQLPPFLLLRLLLQCRWWRRPDRGRRRHRPYSFASATGSWLLPGPLDCRPASRRLCCICRAIWRRFATRTIALAMAALTSSALLLPLPWHSTATVDAVAMAPAAWIQSSAGCTSVTSSRWW